MRLKQFKIIDIFNVKKKPDVPDQVAALFTDQFLDKPQHNVQTVKQKIVLNSSQNDIKCKLTDKMKI